MDAVTRVDLSGFSKANGIFKSIDRELRIACEYTIKLAKSEMMMPKHGTEIQYYVGKQTFSVKTRKERKRRVKTHIQSAPGEAPAIRTGQLYNSFFRHPGVRDLEYIVGVNAPYGRYLELELDRPFLISSGTRMGRILVERVKALFDGI
jgi:hypothetical protein